MVQRQFVYAVFVARIYLLRRTQQLCDKRLFKISVFPQFPYYIIPLLQIHHRFYCTHIGYGVLTNTLKVVYNNDDMIFE